MNALKLGKVACMEVLAGSIHSGSSTTRVACDERQKPHSLMAASLWEELMPYIG